MAIDVAAETTIRRARSDVAEYAMDPTNDTRWIGGITEARMLTEGSVGQGSRVHRVARFMGRRIDYVMEVEEFSPGQRLVMEAVESPFPMTVTYEFEDSKDGTLARIRVRGEAGGFYRVAEPLMARRVRRNVEGDLDRLKGILES